MPQQYCMLVITATLPDLTTYNSNVTTCTFDVIKVSSVGDRDLSVTTVLHCDMPFV